MSTEPWEAAEMLDDIIRNSDPLHVMRRSFGHLFDQTVKQAVLSHRINIDPQTKAITVIYYYPVVEIMAGIHGEPENVIEWLSTGLDEGQDVCLEQFSGCHCFAVKQEIISDKHLCTDIDELLKKVLRKMAERHTATVKHSHTSKAGSS
jgi:hypothetical protein